MYFVAERKIWPRALAPNLKACHYQPLADVFGEKARHNFLLLDLVVHSKTLLLRVNTDDLLRYRRHLRRLHPRDRRNRILLVQDATKVPTSQGARVGATDWMVDSTQVRLEVWVKGGEALTRTICRMKPRGGGC